MEAASSFPDFYSNRKCMNVVPSLIKWTGSKRSQVASIMKHVPSYDRYIEPFIGGGAMLYAAGVPGSLAGDIYKPLVDLWLLIKNTPEQVVNRYRHDWTALTMELDGLDLRNLKKTQLIPEYFYKIRDRFNKEQDPLDLNFLMRTCVNGIVRFNKSGEFNNSFHLSRRGMEPDRFGKAVSTWYGLIQEIDFVCQDYEMTLSSAQPGNFVYLDPPYAGNKQRYTNDLDLNRFFSSLEILNTKGVKWALSFDGDRGASSFIHDVPKDLYKQHLMLSSGRSAVNKVLNGQVETVKESLYLNY
jgi:DNA adenine methylase